VCGLPLADGVGRIEMVLLDGEALIGSTLIVCGDAVSAPNDAAHTLRATTPGARLYCAAASARSTTAAGPLRPPRDDTDGTTLSGRSASAS